MDQINKIWPPGFFNLCKGQSEHTGDWIFGYYVTRKENHQIFNFLNDKMMTSFVKIVADSLCVGSPYQDIEGEQVFTNDIIQDKDGMFYVMCFGNLLGDSGHQLRKSGDYCICDFMSFYLRDYGKLAFAPYTDCEDFKYLEEPQIIGNMMDNSPIARMLKDQKVGKES